MFETLSDRLTSVFTNLRTKGRLSEATVRTQVRSILAKLEVSSQIAAVGLAHQAGWTAPDSEIRTPDLHS